ncbi:DNA-3-methyladenine glycosylase 2 family protein [Streptomyces sp. SID13666]|uniref:AlkA N-terminal domain-containing protein n=1 Tax=unclassified Streptomyces TaxID=2593676 RepID=UPI0013BED511|nr:DNA-3-methyladenine glycosylase 2 family protein [Streptomyces sp. SID13666]NEA69995.1 DNA-3-methyladenine glycosylase 2 family protein [Streptomyces sp. SID13588]
MTTYSAVRTTGIYCRPGCGAKPHAENVRTFELAGAAEAAGYRACLRCRPYRVAGTVADDTPELVCRAVQLIIGGTLDEANEAALGARLGVSARHLRRMFHDHLGVTPDQFARSRRAHFARRLLDDSDLSIAEVAFASGFGSLRQFNRAIREVFRSAPSDLRDRRRRGDRLTADGGLVLRMPFTAPYDWDATLDFLAERAVPGVESIESGRYRRTIALDGAPGMLEIGPGGSDHLRLRAHLPYWEGVIHVVERAARLVGIDADPVLPSAQLIADTALGPLIASRPGVRVPGAWGPFEVAVHAVLRQELPAQRARAALGALARSYGPPVDGLGHGLTHAFPSAGTLADVPPDAYGLPDGTGGTVSALARAVVSGSVHLDGGEPLAELVASLVAVPGLGAAAAHHVALRLGARDAFPAGDPDVRRAVQQLAASLEVSDSPYSPDSSADLDAVSAPWRPWRALATVHLLVGDRHQAPRTAPSDSR